jgi:hypothetical protein
VGPVVSGTEAFDHLRDSLAAAEASVSVAPMVRIVTAPSLGADRFVEPTLQLSADAYAAVIAVDYDGRAHVIFPERSSASTLVRRDDARPVGRFFAGFGSERPTAFAGSRYGLLHRALASTIGRIFAVASDRPLRLDALASASGEWSEPAIEELLRGLDANGAARALGEAVTAADQDFDTDVASFTESAAPLGARFASFGAAGCTADAVASGAASVPRRAVRYVEMDGVQYARLVETPGCASGTSARSATEPGTRSARPTSLSRTRSAEASRPVSGFERDPDAISGRRVHARAGLGAPHAAERVAEPRARGASGARTRPPERRVPSAVHADSTSQKPVKE